MKFEEALKKVEQTLADAKEKIRYEDIEVSTVISYQDENGDECDADNKSLRFLAGEIFIKHKELGEDEKLGYCMVIDCKRKNAIPDAQVSEETDAFTEEIDRFVCELEQAECPPMFISALAQIAEQETAELEEKLKEQMAKIDKSTKTVNIITIAAAAAAVLLIIITQLIK